MQVPRAAARGSAVCDGGTNVEADEIRRKAEGGRRITMRNHSRRSSRRPLGVIAPIAVMVLIVAACSSSTRTAPSTTTAAPTSMLDDDPAGVLADYAEARNSGDVDAVMASYADDAVYENHPLDNDELATGVAEIRSLEARVPQIQGSTGGIEYTEMVVSGNTVTFSHTFHNAQGDCFGSAGNGVTVEGDKITLYVSGDSVPDHPSLCG